MATLLTLPREIRDNILANLLISPSGLTPSKSRLDPVAFLPTSGRAQATLKTSSPYDGCALSPTNLDLAILRVNHQLYEEGMAMFHENTVDIIIRGSYIDILTHMLYTKHITAMLNDCAHFRRFRVSSEYTNDEAYWVLANLEPLLRDRIVIINDNDNKNGKLLAACEALKPRKIIRQASKGEQDTEFGSEGEKKWMARAKDVSEKRKVTESDWFTERDTPNGDEREKAIFDLVYAINVQSDEAWEKGYARFMGTLGR